MPKILARRCLLLGFAAVVAFGGACASVKAFQVQRQYVKDATAKHVYKKPIAEIWPEMRKLLFERGFTAKDTGSETSYSVETTEKKDGDTLVKYLVLGTKVDDASSRVEFTKVSTGLLGPSSERDLDLENVFMRRVDFDSADKIEREATAAGEKSKS
jgi:hypothetical protein